MRRGFRGPSTALNNFTPGGIMDSDWLECLYDFFGCYDFFNSRSGIHWQIIILNYVIYNNSFQINIL